MLSYNTARDGILDTVADIMYVIDDYGNLTIVMHSLFDGYYIWEI